MPITLPPISRRQFLAGSLAAGAGLLARSAYVLAEEPAVDPHRFALLADTHIAADRNEVNRGVNMADNFQAVSQALLSLETRPTAIFIGGDCAYQAGKSEDYAVLTELLQPLRESGLPIHLILGNHDHRERFLQAVNQPETNAELAGRHVAIVKTARANWFLLDSLRETNETPGELGARQRDWLAAALDTRANKPALVLVHHNPNEEGQPTGLTDTQPLLEILAPREQVKALFYGHTHDWHIKQQDGIHQINLPPTAYLFAPGKPNGWVDLQLEESGATLELHCLDAHHPQHGERIELTWRT